MRIFLFLLLFIFAASPCVADDALQDGLVKLVPEDAPEKDDDTPKDMTFHPARTEQEKALDKLIINASSLLNFEKRENNEYIGLSSGLLDSIFEEEAYATRKKCDGSEPLGTSCGLDYNPVLCASYAPDMFFYMTEKAGDKAATIKVARTEDGHEANVYTMVKTDDDWEIDSIDCYKLLGFNLK